MLACENGTYGYDCNNTCGHCTDKETCSHTNGTCLVGCDPGYVGELCKTRKFFTYRTQYRIAKGDLSVIIFFIMKYAVFCCHFLSPV